jgi:hypothetical protein
MFPWLCQRCLQPLPGGEVFRIRLTAEPIGGPARSGLSERDLSAANRERVARLIAEADRRGALTIPEAALASRELVVCGGCRDQLLGDEPVELEPTAPLDLSKRHLGAG